VSCAKNIGIAMQQDVLEIALRSFPYHINTIAIVMLIFILVTITMASPSPMPLALP
jgi:hypothetical protein